MITHGQCYLTASTNSLLSLSGWHGGNLYVKSVTTGDYLELALGPNGIGQELFNGTAYVHGVPNQSLAPDSLYSVYVRNLNGLPYIGPPHNVLDFYVTFAGYDIQTNGDCITIGPPPIDNLTYVGLVFTGNSNISTVIGPSDHMRQTVYSHYNQIFLGFQSNVVSVSGFTQGMSGIQASPSILLVTEGLSDCPVIDGTLNFHCNVEDGDYVSYQIVVKGTAINGTGGFQPWESRSPLQFHSVTKANRWQQLTATWQSAPPIGVYTAYPVINYFGSGSLTYRTQLLGKLHY